MRLRTLLLVTAVGLGGMLSVAQSAEASPRYRGRPAYRTHRPAPRYYDHRYSRPYSYSHRPYSYGYRPYGYGYSYDPYYYAPYYYDSYYYYGRRPVYRSYRPFHRPRVGISLHLGW